MLISSFLQPFTGGQGSLRQDIRYDYNNKSNENWLFPVTFPLSMSIPQSCGKRGDNVLTAPSDGSFWECPPSVSVSQMLRFVFCSALEVSTLHL